MHSKIGCCFWARKLVRSSERFNISNLNYTKLVKQSHLYYRNFRGRFVLLYQNPKFLHSLYTLAIRICYLSDQSHPDHQRVTLVSFAIFFSMAFQVESVKRFHISTHPWHVCNLFGEEEHLKVPIRNRTTAVGILACSSTAWAIIANMYQFMYPSGETRCGKSLKIFICHALYLLHEFMRYKIC